jgi:hypothetical protein
MGCPLGTMIRMKWNQDKYGGIKPRQKHWKFKVTRLKVKPIVSFQLKVFKRF